MCRFLLVKNKKPIRIYNLLQAFAQACQKSRTPDGDRHADGWGISFLAGNGCWIIRHSLLPIWKEVDIFPFIPESRFFIVHARSASFPEQKGLIEYNQPFVSENYVYVFNGFIKGMLLPEQIEGNIGSQKLWSLLKIILKRQEPRKALIALKDLCRQNAREINALNIGLCDGDKIYGLCYFEQYPEYYSMYLSRDLAFTFISSEKLSSDKSERISSGSVIVF